MEHAKFVSFVVAVFSVLHTCTKSDAASITTTDSPFASTREEQDFGNSISNNSQTSDTADTEDILGNLSPVDSLLFPIDNNETDNCLMDIGLIVEYEACISDLIESQKPGQLCDGLLKMKHDCSHISKQCLPFHSMAESLIAEATSTNLSNCNIEMAAQEVSTIKNMQDMRKHLEDINKNMEANFSAEILHESDEEFDCINDADLLSTYETCMSDIMQSINFTDSLCSGLKKIKEDCSHISKQCSSFHRKAVTLLIEAVQLNATACDFSPSPIIQEVKNLDLMTSNGRADVITAQISVNYFALMAISLVTYLK